MTGSDSFPTRPSNMPQVGSFKIRREQHWKRRLKSEFEFFSRFLLRLFQLSYSNVCEPSPEAEVVQWPPTAKNCTKNKCEACANCSTFACVLSTPGYSHHMGKCYPLSYQLYLVYLAVFFTWVSCWHRIWRSWFLRNKRSEVVKDDKKENICVYRVILFQTLS